MEELLRLYFDEKNKRQSIAIYLKNQELEYITLIDNIVIFYEGGVYLKITSGSFGYYMRYALRDFLHRALEGKLVLDDSIKKSLGYYNAQDFKRNNRKNLKYVIADEGYTMWIGKIYNLFGAASSYNQDTWLYNDKEGNIIFEITPSYPWLFNVPQKGETFVKYSQWLKEYRPYVVRNISKETVQKWLDQIDALIQKVTLNDERLTCQGSECEMCKTDGPPLRQ